MHACFHSLLSCLQVLDGHTVGLVLREQNISNDVTPPSLAPHVEAWLRP